MNRILLVLIGGSIGAVCRYGVNLLSVKLYGNSFPWGTMAVNLVGCFLIGLAFALGNERNILSPSARIFFMTGFLGALTTFSSFALETISFSRGGMLTPALINILINNIGGLGLVVAGMWVGRAI